MIIIVRKNNIALISLLFILAIALYSLSIGGNDENTTVLNGQIPQKTILVDAGHGGEDPGAVSDYSGIREKDINLNIALKLKELLEKENFKVLLTREDDKLEYSSQTKNIVQKRKEDLTHRKKMMDEIGANIVVSVHLNKFPQTKYFGAQTFFPPNSNESQRLAIAIQKSIRETVDPNNTRDALVKKEPIIILKDNKTTTAIVECGFLSNPEEEKKLGTSEYQDKIALAIKDGVIKFFQNN